MSKKSTQKGKGRLRPQRGGNVIVNPGPGGDEKKAAAKKHLQEGHSEQAQEGGNVIVNPGPGGQGKKAAKKAAGR